MTLADIPAAVAALRKTFDSGRTRDLEWRKEQLRRVGAMIAENEAAILDALRADLGKHKFEGWITETGYLRGDAAHARKDLGKWTKPERVSTPLAIQPGKSRILREPLGVVLVIGPWNYPVQLVIGPVIGAVAAGNCVVIKPSEVAARSSAILAELVPKYLDPDAVRVIEGGVPETTALLAERFDHVFYTGNGTVGRIVMEAAAKHLTPVTLELGGKSPCYVDRDVDLDVTARRIAWGKWVNAGQTCVAPDYVLAHEAVADALVEKLRTTLKDFYGDDPKASPSYARIVNERHHRRLLALLGDGERAVIGGEHDEKDRYIAPTVLRDVRPDARVMGDEIFGPILPMLTVNGPDEAIAFINARPKPLALYVFSRSTDVADDVLARTSSGGACVNDCVTHLGVPELPFGGVGASGMGAYHGRASFETFSHRKSVLVKGTSIDPALRYPPYTDDKEKWARRLV